MWCCGGWCWWRGVRGSWVDNRALSALWCWARGGARGRKGLKEGSPGDNGGGRDDARDHAKRRTRVLSNGAGRGERKECKEKCGDKAQARRWKKASCPTRRSGTKKPQGQPSKGAELHDQSEARKEKESPGAGNGRDVGTNVAGRRARRAWDRGAGEGDMETELRGGRRKADEEEEEKEGCETHAGKQEGGTDTAV